MIKLNPPYINVEETMPLVEQVLRSGTLTQGPMVEEFEELCRGMTGAHFAVAVSNATVGLELTISTLGIKPGDEIITTPFTFVATINAILRAGAIPRFADIQDDYTIDPQSVKKLINEKTRAIIPVHIYGYPAELGALRHLASENGIKLISDASQAHGSRWCGRPIGWDGGFQDYASVFSFYATKNICAGEGGVITTNNESLYSTLLNLRNHIPGGIGSRVLPTNARMSELDAAVAIPQLNRLDEINARRRGNALILQSYLGQHIHTRDPSRISNFHLFTVEHSDPQGVIKKLKDKGIEARSYYRYIHDSYMVSIANGTDKFPNAYKKAARVVSIPVHPGLDISDVDWIGYNAREALVQI